MEFTEFEGKVALITGAASGMGLLFAENIAFFQRKIRIFSGGNGGKEVAAGCGVQRQFDFC